MSRPSIRAERGARSLRHTARGQWWPALARAARRAFRVNLAQATLIPAIRSALGFGLPLVVGLVSGNILAGVSLAGGAMSAGAIGLASPRRERIRTMLWACAGIALSALTGSLVGGSNWLTIAAAGAWGFGAGLLVTLGQPALVVGLQSAIALIILAHFALPPAVAIQQAALMFAGALFQTLLALFPLSWRHAAAERSALSAVFQRLARYASDPADEQLGEQVRDELASAAGIVDAGEREPPAGDLYGGLLAEAEHIRLNLLILRRWRQRAEQSPSSAGVPASAIDELLAAAAAQLRAVAAALAARPAAPAAADRRRPLNAALAELRQHLAASERQEAGALLIAVGARLRDQLDRATKLAKSARQRPQYRPRLRARAPLLPPIRQALTSIRANLTLRSAVFRHSLRLGSALALATALYRLAPLPFNHGYWIPITTLLVLRPDFSTTFTRGTARLVGTVLGAALATLLIRLVAPASAALVALDILMAYLAYSVLLLNYALFSACITVETVLLLTLANDAPQATAFDRVLATLAGGALALLIYALWPTWEHRRVFDDLATYVERLRRYLGAVLNAYVDSQPDHPESIAARRRATRLARANVAAAIERMRSEPHQRDADLADGLRIAAQTLASSVLALDGFAHVRVSGQSLPSLAEFARAADAALRAIEQRLRDPGVRPAWPDLQPALHVLRHARPERAAESPALALEVDLLQAEAERIVRALDTMRQLSATRQ
jgi:uncharacterized membrane protein YccC